MENSRDVEHASDDGTVANSRPTRGSKAVRNGALLIFYGGGGLLTRAATKADHPSIWLKAWLILYVSGIVIFVVVAV
jgi:hypothetical protein